MDQSREPTEDRSPPQKKFKKDCCEQQNSAQIESAADELLLISASLPIAVERARQEFMPKDEKQGFEDFIKKQILQRNQAKSSKQLIVTNQRERYYAQKLVLQLHHLQHEYAQEQLVENDGSLINQLDEDCLIKIFKYLPVNERMELEKVCQQWKRVVDFAWSDIKKLYFNHDDFEYTLENELEVQARSIALQSIPKLIKRCGRYLDELDLTVLPSSVIVPVIKYLCPNLIKLQMLFHEVVDKHFKDAFIFMPNLKSLEITWDSKISMPKSFIESLNAISDTLEELKLIKIKIHSEYGEKNNDFSDSWILTFRRFESLKSLMFHGYNLNYAIIEAINQNENLVKLELSENDWGAGIYGTKMYPFSNLQNLEHLEISQIAVTDYFLINLAEKSKNLKYLKIDISSITDVGVIPLTQLKNFKELITDRDDDETYQLTDKSIKKFKNMKKLYCQQCTGVTNYSIIKVLENSPDLEELNICSTGVTIEIVEIAAEITKNRKNDVVLQLIVKFSENPAYSSPWLQVQNEFDEDDY